MEAQKFQNSQCNPEQKEQCKRYHNAWHRSTETKSAGTSPKIDT
jgi:hypothetical protein